MPRSDALAWSIHRLRLTAAAARYRGPRQVLDALPVDDVHGFTDRRGGRLAHRLRQGRVRVDREIQILHDRAHLDRQRRLADEVARAVADDVHAQDLLGLRIADDLRETL